MKGKYSVFQSVAFRTSLCLVTCVIVPEFALAQSADPFESGANNLVTSITALLTPVAVLLVMGLGVAAATGKISWGWVVGLLIGMGLFFAAPNVVTWMKGLYSA